MAGPFWQRFVTLCNQRNETPSAVAVKLGFSSGTATWWKKGRVPRSAAVAKIAAYFGVPLNYFFENGEREDEKILALYRLLGEREKNAVISLLELLNERKVDG